MATPDPVIWTVGQIPGARVFLTGQLRNLSRFQGFVQSGIGFFVDVAGDAPYVWRPEPDAIAAAGVVYRRVRGVEDTNIDLPDAAFDAVAQALGEAAHLDREALVFCAAGLKRSPHLLYGVLRRGGLPAAAAWEAVLAARPFAEQFPPYVAAAERWATRASESRSG